MTPPAKHLTIAARPLGWTVAVCIVAFAVVLGLVAALWPPLLTGEHITLPAMPRTSQSSIVRNSPVRTS